MIKDASGLVYYAVLAGLQDQKAEARRCDETNRHYQLSFCQHKLCCGITS